MNAGPRDSAEPGRPRWRRWLPTLASLVILAIAGTVLVRELAAVEPREVLAHLAAIPVSSLVLAIGFAVAAFLVLALYEVQMLRELRGPGGWRRPVLAALIAYPVGHVVGFGALSGGAVRYRVYAPAGLRPAELPRLMLFSVMPYAMSLGLLAGILLLLYAELLAPAFGVSEAAAGLLGVALLLSHVGWVLLILRRREPLSLGRWRLELPSPRLTLFQYLLGATEVCCAGAVLYCLLPAEGLPAYGTFLAIYIAAMAGGVASGVPAGLGVFESLLLLTLPGLPGAELVGAVLAYRLVYQLLPLGGALLLLLGFESWAPRRA